MPVEAVVANTTVQMTARVVPQAKPKPKPRPSANRVVANRFPAGWQNTIDSNLMAPQAMAFAAEPNPSHTSSQSPAQTAGYQLASVDPAPAPMPKRVERKAKPKNQVLFNDAQLVSIKARLRLTPDQEQYWPAVEEALRAISWRLATRQDSRRPVRGHQAQMIDPGSPEVARLKSAAFPLIMSMRADQKEQVRQLAHTMGLSQVASMF